MCPAPSLFFVRNAKTKFLQIWKIGIQIHKNCILNVWHKKKTKYEFRMKGQIKKEKRKNIDFESINKYKNYDKY